ncbi:MAG: AAA family ATPase [Alphaproteobacteria bacterium]|nr:AAA family ATPase [Alphaproteobacteria bacterium]
MPPTDTQAETAKAAPRPIALDGSRLIAVGSGKGGVGKTWFSVTLSHCLARQGRRILLFDADLGLANVDIQLGLMPERDIGDVIAGTTSLPRAVTHYAQGGFDILAGRSGGGSLASAPPPRLLRLRQELIALSQSYDKTVLDLAAGVDRTVQILSTPAAQVLIVINDEPTSLTDAYAFIKLAHQAGHHAAIQIVVNMADSESAGRKTYEALAKSCRSFLKFTPPLAGVIRRDAKVRECIRAQLPIVTRSPDSQAVADVEAIVTRLLVLPS